MCMEDIKLTEYVMAKCPLDIVKVQANIKLL